MGSEKFVAGPAACKVVADIIGTETPDLPAALSQQELLEHADLAGQVRIMKIIWARDKTSPHLAHLHLEKITKGTPQWRFPLLARLRLSRTIEVKMRRIKRDHAGRKLAGEWSDGYRVGDRVMTHLFLDPESGGYRTLSWNAVWQTPLS
ncbi:MAG: hypothetical protein JWM91_2427 [Rhodospirillales bacterium]|nr:hypothetical protein [Rhodospirillales bacterium]